MPDTVVSDDFAQCLTGAGRGAVAVIRFRCSQLTNRHPADCLFRSVGGKTLSQCKIGRITYGDWRLEDVVVVRTRPDEWEVNCHGGPAPIQRILSDLETAGIPSVDQRATTPESVAEDSVTPKQQLKQLLLRSKTIPTADLILSQPDAFQEFSARIQNCDNSAQATELINHFLSWKPFADHLVEPWIVAIVGKPNAGKSSFLNAIIGYQRSIVFDQPGTTRDLVQCDIVIGGWPVQLVDTAGIRNKSNDKIEQQGIAAARQMIQSADLCIVISDQNAGWSDEDNELLELAQHRIPACVIHNKSDLPPASSPSRSNETTRPDAALDIPDDVTTFRVCSTMADGIQPVIDWISQAVVPKVPAPNEPLPIFHSLVEACHAFHLDEDLQQLQTTAANFAKSLVDKN
ncbi:MAG: GTPase [Fuerstiella sp.]